MKTSLLITHQHNPPVSSRRLLAHYVWPRRCNYRNWSASVRRTYEAVVGHLDRDMGARALTGAAFRGTLRPMRITLLSLNRNFTWADRRRWTRQWMATSSSSPAVIGLLYSDISTHIMPTLDRSWDLVYRRERPLNVASLGSRARPWPARLARPVGWFTAEPCRE
jgi:hypothetical protein